MATAEELLNNMSFQYTDTISWNGDIEGRAKISGEELEYGLPGDFYKIYDEPVHIDNIINGVLTIQSKDGENIRSVCIVDNYDGCFITHLNDDINDREYGYVFVQSNSDDEVIVYFMSLNVSAAQKLNVSPGIYVLYVRNEDININLFDGFVKSIKAPTNIFKVSEIDGGDDEPHIVIDNTRKIIVPDRLKKIAVQQDHNIETVTFECPRYWDGIDLSTMAVYINYMRSDGYKDKYPVKNLRTIDNTMLFDWTISRNVTEVKGNITFLVCINTTNDSGIEINHWNSELCKDMYVSEGMETEEQITPEVTDLVTQLLIRRDSGLGLKTPEGGEIFNDYEYNAATGSKSHAEGRRTQAKNDYAHSEGNETFAGGDSSHAEGTGTRAEGRGAHSEGDATKALGEASHAEGATTEATGSMSHAEGVKTTASGDYSHAEGTTNEASGTGSHAEGVETIASGNYSHVEGTYARAYGLGAHAEGSGTYAIGEYSHAEGVRTVARGKASSARNHTTEAGGEYSSAEGHESKAIGEVSHAEGHNTEASGSASHAEGIATKASHRAAHAEGDNTQAAGEASHAEGYTTEASGQFSHAEGYNTKATGAYSHSAGQGTVADSAAQTVVGRFNKSNGRALFIVGNGTADEKRNNVFVVYGDGSGAVVTEQGQSDSSVVRMDTMKTAIAEPKSSISLIDTETGETYSVYIKNGELIHEKQT